jgi:hypothetical protein
MKKRVQGQGSLNFWAGESDGSTDLQRDIPRESDSTGVDAVGTSSPHASTLSHRDGLVEQIIRDEQTLRNGWYEDDCPGEEFYEQRIAVYHEAILKLDRENKNATLTRRQ